jgi:hypothetical protein
MRRRPLLIGIPKINFLNCQAKQVIYSSTVSLTQLKKPKIRKFFSKTGELGEFFFLTISPRVPDSLKNRMILVLGNPHPTENKLRFM